MVLSTVTLELDRVKADGRIRGGRVLTSSTNAPGFTKSTPLGVSIDQKIWATKFGIAGLDTRT